MRRKVILKEVISVVKLSVFPIWGWPVPQNATKFIKFCMTLHHCLSIIVAIGVLLPLMYGITNNLNNPVVLTNQIVMFSGITHATFNFIFHIVNYHHIQIATFEMVNFCDLMKPYEEVVIQRYIDKCIMFHGISLFNFYWMTFITIAIIPPLMHRPFPTLAEYPFNVFYQPLKTIIFIHQSIVGIMVAGQLCMNVYMALLLWFASARFEILSEELRQIINVYQLFECIKKHQKLLIYTKEITNAARPFAFTTVCCSTVSLIVLCLLIISHQPVAVILQFIELGAACVAEVFMYTWPAENLMYTSKDVAQTAFHLLKNNHLIEIWKYLQIIIIRSQKPITISIPCFLPELSLNYFTSYLSTILSYFTTLRVIMDDNNN